MTATSVTSGRGGMPGSTDKSWSAGVQTDMRSFALAGIAATALFVLGFGTWAALAPLSGAAVAPGIVAAAGQNQRVQHLEGGIVRKILVREGERVEAGQALIELDPTAAEAQKNRLQKQLVGLRARAERLVAERDGADSLAFPADLVDLAASEGVTELLDEQVKEFIARLQRHRQEQSIMQQRELSLREQVEGLKAQSEAIEKQIDVIGGEVGRKEDLLGQGLANRSEYTALLRSQAELVGQRGQALSGIQASTTQILEAQEMSARVDTQRVENALSALHEVRAQIADVEEQIRTASDILDRIVVRSPSDGVVVQMAVNVNGSVVRPGETLIELLPTADKLVIEARVPPRDVDVVKPGQSAQLRFSAFNSRTTPTVEATVTYLSADRLVDPTTHEPYYVARLQMTDALPPDIAAEQIYPGMPVETYILTGERTFLEYLTKPITDSFNRAFREE